MTATPRGRSPALGAPFDEVDLSGLALFRILFGFLLFAETCGAILTGWVGAVFVRAEFTFPMLYLPGVQPPGGHGMTAVFAVMAVCGLAVMVGWRYRLALGVFGGLWTATCFLQTTAYNNHYYLMALLCVLMWFTPANAWASLDARRDPALRSPTSPRWCLQMLVLQVAIVYVYAAIAKLDVDWLDGKTIGALLAQRRGYALGFLYGQGWFRELLVWGGLLFDASIVPLLLWRRTRVVAIALSVGFHLFNSYTFRIGVFPYMAMALLVLFVDPERIRVRVFPSKPAAPAAAPRRTPRRRLVLGALGVWFAVQLLFPFRHLAFPGRASWTEEGHRLAWRMMLRNKQSDVRFILHDPETGRRWMPDVRARLTPWQAHKIGGSPDMIWQMAQRLAAEERAGGRARVEVYAMANAGLNGRRRQPIVDPTVDLAAQPWELFAAAPWIEPLRELPPIRPAGTPPGPPDPGG